MASNTLKRRRSRLSLPSGPRGRSIEVEFMPPPPRRPRTHDGAHDQDGTGPAGTRTDDDSASPESAPGNTRDDDYIYPDTGGVDDDDDDDMHVAVGQPAGPIQGRAAEEAARQEELARVLAESRRDARSNENASSGGAAEASASQGSSSSRGASGEHVPARHGLTNGGSTCWLNTLIQVASSPRTTLGRMLMELSRCDWDDAMKEGLSALWQMVDATGKVTSAEPCTPSIHAGFVGANGILKPAGFKAWEQQDLGEAFFKIWELLQSQATATETPLPPPLAATTMTTSTNAQCSSCGLVHSVGDGSLKTHHLMLALPDESSDSTITLQGLLDDSTAPREMSDAHCARCSQLTSSQQVTLISEAPATLVVMINRTGWIDGTGGHGGKDGRAVQFDRVASLLLRSASGTTRTQRYDVRGIGVHIGPSLNAGHYKAFVAGRNDTWVCADDADTTEVSWRDVRKVNPTIMVLERQHGGGAAATHGTDVPAFWSAAVAAARGQASGSGGQAPGGVSGDGSSETDDDGSSSGETDGDGSSSCSGSGSGGSRSRSSSRSRSRSRSRSSSGGGSSGGSGSSSYEADDLRRHKGKVPSSNDALGPPNQPVQPVPQNKKRQRAVEPIAGALQELAGTPEEVQKFLRLSTEASPQQLGLCRALLKDGGAGLLSAKHASNGCRIYRGGATSGSDLGPATIRNILAAASQTRGPVGDMAAVLDGPESTERRRAEEGLRRLRVAAKAGDVVAFLGVCGEIDVSIHIDTTHPAFANNAGRTEPLLVGWGACPKYAESPFYDPDCPLLTGKLWRAAVKASPFGGDAGGAIAALNKNNSCSRSVHDRGGNCFDSKTMPPRVRELSRTFLDLTCTLLINRFPNVHALMVLSFGEVCDQGAARHGVVWSGRDDKVGMFASHHICTIPGGLPAATSNFAGLCLLHHAARDREGCRTLEDLGGERRRSAVAEAVDALVGAQDFVAPQKGAAAFDGEKEALRAGVEENDEVFEEAFNAIRTRLGPALFTTQQRSDGGAAKYTAEERGAEKSTVELKAEGGEASMKKRKQDPKKFQDDCAAGARTATVNGQKVTVREGVWQGREAATPAEEAAMRRRSADSASGADTAWVRDGKLVSRDTSGAVKITSGGASLKGKADYAEGAALPGGGTSKGTQKGKAAAGKKMQGKKMHSSGGSRGPGAAAKTYVDINAYRTLIVSSRHRSYVKEDGTVRTSARRRSESKWFAYKDVRGINGGKDIFGLKQFDTNGKERNLSYPSDASGKDLSGFMGLGESNRLFEGDLQTYARCAAST